MLTQGKYILHFLFFIELRISYQAELDSSIVNRPPFLLFRQINWLGLGHRFRICQDYTSSYAVQQLNARKYHEEKEEKKALWTDIIYT